MVSEVKRGGWGVHRMGVVVVVVVACVWDLLDGMIEEEVGR